MLDTFPTRKSSDVLPCYFLDAGIGPHAQGIERDAFRENFLSIGLKIVQDTQRIDLTSKIERFVDKGKVVLVVDKLCQYQVVEGNHNILKHLYNIYAYHFVHYIMSGIENHVRNSISKGVYHQHKRVLEMQRDYRKFTTGKKITTYNQYRKKGGKNWSHFKSQTK